MGGFKEFIAEQKVKNDTPVKVTCARCAGSGKYSFNLIHGDKCLGCSGRGYVMSTVGKEKAKEKRRAKAEEKAKSDAELRKQKESEMAASWENAVEKYKDDPRIGDHVKDEMKKNSHWLESVVSLLRSIDAGTAKQDIPDHWKPRHYHNVKFADKDAAKKEGMLFDADKKKWYHLDAKKSEISKFPKS